METNWSSVARSETGAPAPGGAGVRTGAGGLASRLRSAGYAGGTPALLLLGLAGLLLSVRDLGRLTDSVPTFANAFACLWLATAVSAVLSGRRLGLTRTLLVGWVVLGVVRGIISVGGIPTGWMLAQSIEAQGRFSQSQTHVGELRFGAGEVPAHLINDTHRFNFRAYDDDVPDRTKLPVAIRARSYVAGTGALVISSSSPIRIAVGGEVMELRPPIFDYRREIAVSQEEPVEIAMEATGVDRAALAVRTEGLTVYSEPTAGLGMSIRRLLGRAAPGLDLLTVVAGLATALVALGGGTAVLRRQRLLGLVVTGFVLFLVLAPHLITWVSQREGLLILSGGDDWLTYESFARDIRLNSPLMLSGKPTGQADPFYYQPLYPYVVALSHMVVGESVQGIVLLQLLGVAAVLVLAYLALPSGGMVAATLAVIALGTGVLGEWTLMAGRLLSENLMLLVLALLLYKVSRLRPVPSITELAIIGAILGIAGLARSTAWAAAPFVIILLLRGLPRRSAVPFAAIILLPMVLLAFLVPARNLVASGTPALLPTSGSINLYMGIVPTGRKLSGEPWTELAKTHDPRLVAAAEAVVNAPDQVAKKLMYKALYVLGFPRTLDSGNPVVFWPVLSLWLLAPLGLLYRNHSRLAWTCLILAITHALSLVLIFPDNYYYRLVMPATLPLLIWDVLGVYRVVRGLEDATWAGLRVKQFVRSQVGWNSER